VVLDNLHEGDIVADRRCFLYCSNLLLLPVWRTRRSSRPLRRSRSGLLRITARVDRATRQSAMRCATPAHSASTNQLLREHIRQKRGSYRIKTEDHPKKMPRTTAQLLRLAGRAGTQIGVVCESLPHRQREPGIRRILGVLSLAKKYVEDACSAALEICVPEYRFAGHYPERRRQERLPWSSPGAST
jgi:hypothetical protein